MQSCDINIAELRFSYYEYIPQSLIDERKVFCVSKSDFLDEGVICSLIDCVPPGKELSFHSLVTLDSGVLAHIPMVDMSTGSAAQLAKLRPYLGDDIYQYFTWYKSGRSYHGYGSILISYDAWAAQMGRLLLANQIGTPPTVDPRWVGHRLIAGYSALRWTKNTAHYIEIPKRIS